MTNKGKAEEILGPLGKLRSQLKSLVELQGFELMHFHVQPETQEKPAHITAVLRVDPDFKVEEALDEDWAKFLEDQNMNETVQKSENLRAGLDELLNDLSSDFEEKPDATT